MATSVSFVMSIMEEMSATITTSLRVAGTQEKMLLFAIP